MALAACKDVDAKRPSRDVTSSDVTPDISGPLRHCIASGEALPKEALLRFVVGPDGSIVPDLAGTLPGRGIWVRADRAALEIAIKRKAFARAARQQVFVAPDLADEVARQIRAAALNILGLARRSGVVVTGFEKVREAQAADGALMQVTAAGRGGTSRRLETFAQFTSEELSQALGRENVVHVALRKSPIADRFTAACERLAGFECPPSSSASAPGVADDTD